MFGASYYGATCYASGESAPTIVTAEIVLALRTNPPVPPGQPIPLGNDIEITAAFLNEGEPVEPSTVTCQLEGPRGGMETPAVIREAFGRWQALIRPNLPGRWVYRIQAGGDVVGAEEGVFWIANSTIV